MPGSWKHTKEKDLRDFLSQKYPDAILISRKPTNTEAIVINSETGKVIARGKANGEVLDQLTDPNFRFPKKKRLLGDDIPAREDLKKRAENTANQIICYLNEFIEINQSNKFRFEHDKSGFVKRIKFGDLVYKLK